MSFEQLQQAILKEADKRSQAVADEFYEQFAKEESRIKEKAREIEESIVEQGVIKGKDEAKRLHQEAALQMRALVLYAKQTELDKTKELFKQELLMTDTDKLTDLLKGLVKNIPQDKGKVTLGSKHAKQLTQLITQKGIEIDKDTIKDEGGFIYSNDDMELNLTIGQLVDDLFSRYRTEIANTLFT